MFGDLVDNERFVSAYRSVLASLHPKGARAPPSRTIASGVYSRSAGQVVSPVDGEWRHDAVTLPLRVTVAPERADAAPGDNLAFDVTVRNASDIVEHYGVEMLGLPDGATVRTEPDVAKLRPAETGTLTVRVNLPVQPPAPAGTYVVGALVRSKYRHDVSRCVEVPVELASVEQITVAATPEVVTGGRGGQYTVEVANGGNSPVRLYLAATDPERRVAAQFSRPASTCRPAPSARALLTVSGAAAVEHGRSSASSPSRRTPDLPGAATGTARRRFVQQPRLRLEVRQGRRDRARR